MGDENKTLEQLRAENEKLQAQMLEYEQTLDSAMKENELLKADIDRFVRENEELRAACKALEKGADAEAEAPSTQQKETRRYRARFRLGLSRGDVMPGEEFEASDEEIEGLTLGEHFDKV